MFKFTLPSWEGLWKGCACVVAFLVLMTSAVYLSSPKEFKGYYLYHNGMEYAIWINWDNAPDECAFKSRNPDETLRVYRELSNGERQIIAPPAPY